MPPLRALKAALSHAVEEARFYGYGLRRRSQDVADTIHDAVIHKNRDDRLEALDTLDMGARNATLPIKGGATVNLHVGPGRFGLAPKEVSWDIGLKNPVDDDLAQAMAVANAYHRETRRIGPDHPAYDDTARRLQDAQNEFDRTLDRHHAAQDAVARRAALPAMRAAEAGVMADMKKRSPFALWSPDSGYAFYGATPTHDKIYEQMVRRNKHPDYYVTTDDAHGYRSRTFRLRRKFPFRHEVAGALAGSVLWPNDANGEDDTAVGGGSGLESFADGDAYDPVSQGRPVDLSLIRKALGAKLAP